MRIGVSSRGNVWLSMGPAGWLILGPFIAAGYLVVFAVQLVAVLASAAWRAWERKNSQKRYGRADDRPGSVH